MHTEIVCRSPEQIRDDELMHEHSDIERLLDAMSCGVCLYRGEQRAQLKRLKAQIEAEILGEGQAPKYLAWAVYAVIRVS